MPLGNVKNYGALNNPDGVVPPGGTTNQVLTKQSNTDYDSIWADAGAGSGDVTKDELAGATLVTTIGDTEHLPISVAGSPNSIKKIVWTAFKTVLDGIYALTGHNHDSAYTAKNVAIVAATKTKITYDTKGLVTSGADATQDDIGDGSTYKQYSSTEKSKLSGIEASADVTDLTNVSSSINGASAVTPVDADKFPFVDADDNTIKTVTGANLKTYIGASGGLDIHGLTGESALAAADEVPFYDDSVSANRKVTYTNLVSNLGTSFDIKGGSSGQYLKKDGAGDYAFTWDTPSASVDIHSLTAATIADADEVIFWDATDSTNKKSTFVNAWYEIAKKIYPIGCIYTTTSSTNPGTTFGFGTWSQFGSGRVLIGQTSSDTDFDTAEETGGNKTIDLSHYHNVNGGLVGLQMGGSPMPIVTPLTTDVQLSATTNIMNPYIVVYFWKRTA